jgi:hypothetical protein
MGCRDCAEGLDHCHDVLLVHPDGSVECSSGPGCAGGAATHEWVVIVDEVLPLAA